MRDEEQRRIDVENLHDLSTRSEREVLRRCAKICKIRGQQGPLESRVKQEHSIEVFQGDGW